MFHKMLFGDYLTERNEPCKIITIMTADWFSLVPFASLCY